MFESLYKAFENFVVEFSLRRLAGTLLLAVLLLGGFNILDRYSPYFTMGRLERATALLERLSAFDASNLSQTDDLGELRAGIVRQLRSQVEPPPLIGFLAVGGATVSLWKFGAGVAPWLLFALLLLPNVRVDSSNWSAVLGAVFIGLVFGFLATVFIPDDWGTWRVLVSYGVGHFLVVVVGILLWQARKTARSRSKD